MTNNSRMLGGAGGVVLVVVGSILVGQGGGLFLPGLLVLLAGMGLVVKTLLQVTETGIKTGDSSGRSGRAGQARAPSVGSLLNFARLKNMPGGSQWAAGALMGLLSLVGLFLYSRAGDGMFALFGGLLFIFGIAVIVVFVHQATDYSSPAADGTEAAAGTGSAGDAGTTLAEQRGEAGQSAA